MLAESGPFLGLFFFCIGFSIFSRIFTTTLWGSLKGPEGLPDFLGLFWSAEYPTVSRADRSTVEGSFGVPWA